MVECRSQMDGRQTMVFGATGFIPQPRVRWVRGAPDCSRCHPLMRAILPEGYLFVRQGESLSLTSERTRRGRCRPCGARNATFARYSYTRPEKWPPTSSRPLLCSKRGISGWGSETLEHYHSRTRALTRRSPRHRTLAVLTTSVQPCRSSWHSDRITTGKLPTLEAKSWAVSLLRAESRTSGPFGGRKHQRSYRPLVVMSPKQANHTIRSWLVSTLPTSKPRCMSYCASCGLEVEP